MGLCYKTTAWTDALWSKHTQRYRTARRVIADGKKKCKAFDKFAEDVHARLYLHNPPAETDNPPQWATQLHSAVDDIPEWTQLKAKCKSNGFSAGIATESILSVLAAQMPDRDDDGNGEGEDSQEGGKPIDGNSGASERRMLRQAIRQAGSDVDDAENQIEAFSSAMGLGRGTHPGQAETLEDVERIRALYDAIKGHQTLQRIMEIAGRLKRISRNVKRVKVTRGVGAVKGITQGGDLDRLLPSEVVSMRNANRVLRLSALQRIIERRALQYLMTGEETLGRGPIIVCCDESGSMGTARLEWSKAVALALLMSAVEQRRTWHILGFNTYITHAETITPGQADQNVIIDAITAQAGGGTDFDAPLRIALDMIETQPDARRADVIFITDGQAPVSSATVERYAEARERTGLSVYVVGIGADANLETLRPMAQQMFTLKRLDKQAEIDMAEVIETP